MKNILYLLLLIILAISSNAQDWELFNESDKYNYLEINDSLIHTVWIDSVSQITDTEMYFNKNFDFKIEYSDLQGINILTGELKHNVLFNQICTKTGDSLFYFGSQKEWLIKPKNKIYDTWEFSSGISATITEYYQDTVFETADSVKTIELSDGQILKVSKTYGIVYWKMSTSCEIELIGIEDKAGLSIPKFEDFFDFEIGDVFQYNIYTYWGLIEYSNKVYKYSITSKEVTGNSFLYGLNVASRNGESLGPDELPQGYHSYTTELLIENSSDFFTNKYLNELIRLDNTEVTYYPGIFDDKLDFLQCDNGDIVYYSMDVQLNKDNEIIKRFHTDIFKPPFKLLVDRPDQNGDFMVESSDCSYNSIFSIELRPGVGVTLFRNMGVEDVELELVGVVIKGDTIGRVDPDSFFINSDEEIFASQVKVYPNPFTDRLSLTLDVRSDLVVFDVKGVKLYESRNEAGDILIDLEFLDPGLYFLCIENDDWSYQKLIVKN